MNAENDMRMIEVRLEEVHADHTWNCRRRPYTAEEVEDAAAMFQEQPMLHPPTIARLDDGRWWLVCGFLRFEVWRAQQKETGLFRWVDGDPRELALLNFVENYGRRDLKPHELVARVADLMEIGYSTKEIAKRCGKKERYIRQLAAIRRDAHPDLWEAFCQSQDANISMGDRRPLTILRMLDLIAHPTDKQLARWKQSSDLEEKADCEARGFSYVVNIPRHGAARRKRLPPRRQIERVLRVMKSEPTLKPDFREGAVTVLEWLLHETDLGNVSLSLSTIAKVAERTQTEGEAV